MLRLLALLGAAGALLPSARPRPARRAPPRMAAVDSTLIIQNKGGGHGEIGYHLALQLAAKGTRVTILHEGPDKGKPPHNAYGDLASAGVEVVWRDNLEDDVGCIGALGGATFAAIVDNWSKSRDQIRPYALLAKGMGVAHYAFVSSAGMYTPAKGEFGAIDEACATKSSGQRQAEELLAELALPYSYFRPQYIYGPKQGKSYLSYFFDRLSRGRAVPVPGDGRQSVTFTHAADNAAMICAALGCEAAVGEAFNCATSSLLSYDELAGLCAKAAGADAKIEHYAPGAAADGFKFPFRDTPFFVSAAKAADKLGFEPRHRIADDIAWYYQDNYVAQGGLEKELDFAADDATLGVSS